MTTSVNTAPSIGFQGDAELRDAILAQVTAHERADEIVQG